MATMGEMEPHIFKRDAAGRVSYSAERREELLDEFERRGMKGAAFARMAGISYPTFATWIQKRRHARGDYRMRPPAIAEVVPRRAPAMRFVEAELAIGGEGEVAPPASCAGGGVPPPLPVHLPCGARMLVGDERQAVLAARILETLAPGRPC